MNRKPSNKKYISVYRTVLCIIAAMSISLCFILNAGNFFEPENLRAVSIGNKGIYIPIKPNGKEKSLPKNDGLYNDEIFMIREKEEPKDNTSEEPAKYTGAYPIVSLDMSNKAGLGEVLINDTDSGITIDVEYFKELRYPESLRTKDVTKLSSSSEPLVLIVHTHATECYSPEGAVGYDDSTSFRSTDTDKNMIAVGKVLTDTLTLNNIPTIQCQTLHDAADYNASYQNSLESVKAYLKEYPSIKYVFDLHRDAIIRENGELIKPQYIRDEESCAQVMTLVGTNALGADHPNWQDNMNLAVKLQIKLTETYNGIARPINTRGASFNQQYAPGSLLFEIGSCANSLSEAKRAAVYLGEAISQTIRENS